MNDPRLSFIGTVIAALIISGATVYSVRSGFEMFNCEQEAKRKFDIFQERKKALFDALHAIDLVYGNECWNGEDPLNPKEWDIELARSATNKMLLYCKDPQKTIDAFYKALGLYNPTVEKATGAHPKYLDEFRKQAANELELPAFQASNPNYTWIASLAGTKEAKEVKRRKARGPENN
jgi:hypothetical protein